MTAKYSNNIFNLVPVDGVNSVMYENAV